MISENEFRLIVKRSNSKVDIGKNLGFLFYNGTVGRVVKSLLEKWDVDISHFQPGKKNVKYETIKKSCPVCKKMFKTQNGHKREKITCSHSCSNTHFRSGKDNPNYKHGGFRLGHNIYQSICFKEHGKKCLVCGESKIVAAHHVDGNHNNNDPMNLVPLCPTHHIYIHSRYKDEVQPTVDKYLESQNKSV